MLTVIVFWCYAALSMADFNPHQIDAVKKFVNAHHESCGMEKADTLDVPDLTPQACKAQMMIRYMPTWQQKNAGKLYMGGDCVPYKWEGTPLDLEAMKEKVHP